MIEQSLFRASEPRHYANRRGALRRITVMPRPKINIAGNVPSMPEGNGSNPARENWHRPGCERLLLIGENLILDIDEDHNLEPDQDRVND